MLLAHLDTVHSQPVQTICKNKDKSILMSPQGIGGDDRCGVYAIVNAYDMAVKKPWLLFTCDEEIGGLGADQFCHAHADCRLPKELDDLKLLVEIDRRGSNDAVYYDCDNKEFEKYIISKGFRTAFGSFSDISVIAPELGVAAVNLSSGYYNAHTLHEYINCKELNAVLQKVNEIVADAAKEDFPKYKYIEKVYKCYESGKYARYYDSKKLSQWKSMAKTTSVLSDGTVTTTYAKAGPDVFEIIDEEDMEDENLFVKALPSEYEEMYDELLTIYTEAELERERARYGDCVIYELYIEIFGPFYAYDQK